MFRKAAASLNFCLCLEQRSGLETRIWATGREGAVEPQEWTESPGASEWEEGGRNGSLGKARVGSSPVGDRPESRRQAEPGQQGRKSQNSRQNMGQCPWISQLGQQKTLYFLKGNQNQRKWKAT